MASVTYRQNPQGVRNLFFAQDGDVQVYLRRLAILTADLARRNAPTDTGRLSRNINVRLFGDGGYEVLANTKYALFVHQGTRPHPITGRPVLRFRWDDGPSDIQRDEDGFVYFHRVNHPGTRPQPWLFASLSFIVTRN